MPAVIEPTFEALAKQKIAQLEEKIVALTEMKESAGAEAWKTKVG